MENGNQASVPQVEWPPRDAEIAAALQDAWADGSWGRYSGRHGQVLAQRLADFHNVPYVRLCSSGTIGVELALRGLGVQPGDEVLLAGYDFSGNFRAIERIGARPVLVDINTHTLAIDAEQLEAISKDNIKAVIVSHLHSGIAPMPQIMSWAERHNVRVVEDACQAPGANVHGRVAGTWGDIGVLSFGGSKLVTAGRGGALLVQRAEEYQRIAVYAEQGNDAFPLSELQAAVLLPQWNKLNELNVRRRSSVKRLVEQLHATVSLRFIGQTNELDWPSYYKVAWVWDQYESTAISRAKLCRELQQHGVMMDSGFRGFAKRSSRRCRVHGDLPVSRLMSDRIVVLHHPILLAADVVLDQAVAVIEDITARDRSGGA